MCRSKTTEGCVGHSVLHVNSICVGKSGGKGWRWVAKEKEGGRERKNRGKRRGERPSC